MLEIRVTGRTHIFLGGRVVHIRLAEPPAFQIDVARLAPSEPTFTPNHRKHNKRGKFKRSNR